MFDPEDFYFTDSDFADASDTFKRLVKEHKGSIEDHGFYVLVKTKADDPELGQDFVYYAVVKPLELTTTLKIFPRIEGRVSGIDCLPDAKPEIDNFYANINQPDWRAKSKAMQSFRRLSTPLMSSTTTTFLRSKLDWDSCLKGNFVVTDTKLCRTLLVNEDEHNPVTIRSSTLTDCFIKSGDSYELEDIGRTKKLQNFIKTWDAPAEISKVELFERNIIDNSTLSGVGAAECAFINCELSCSSPDLPAFRENQDEDEDDYVYMSSIPHHCKLIDCYLAGSNVQLGEADKLQLEKTAVINSRIELTAKSLNQENVLLNKLIKDESREKPGRGFPIYSDSLLFNSVIKNCPFVVDSSMLQCQFESSAALGCQLADISALDCYLRLNDLTAGEGQSIKGRYDIECKLSFDSYEADKLDEYGIEINEREYREILREDFKLSKDELTARKCTNKYHEKLYRAAMHELFGMIRVLELSEITLPNHFYLESKELRDLLEYHLREYEAPEKKDLAALFAQYKDD
ncbi:MAG: hypothetical protein IAB19_06630 [Proteobacteria bacterium]|uniref:Uncharacterized protein n=1 Tax=Candidatus Avisuccinivibrio stercorigallinarum TaxID=2840704 RepID=A0A9D9GUB0_9GAMM|nr:hypothetical protein [Candidatus Avisuccinivibrio stercorigallinarum]